MENSENQWLKNLKKLLECPVCYEIPKKIFFCSMGHNICEICRLQIPKCPVCKKEPSTIRNFFAENVSLMLEDMKKQITQENFKKIDLSKLKLQDDLNPLLGLGKAVNRSWGKFPCCINSTCNFNGCYDEMVQHFENTHPTRYEKMSDYQMPLTKFWSILYEKKKGSINQAFHVENVGLFVFHTNVDEKDNLRVLIRMYGSRSVGKKFSYRIRVESNRASWSYRTEKIFTTRTPMDLVYNGSLSISSTEILVDEDNKKILKCLITIKQRKLR